MAHQVQVNEDGVSLPNGRTYDSGVTVTLSNAEYERLDPDVFDSTLTDMGEVGTDTGSLADLDDVTIDSPQVGDGIKWTGSHWANAQPDPDIDTGPTIVGGGGGVIANHWMAFHATDTPLTEIPTGSLIVPWALDQTSGDTPPAGVALNTDDNTIIEFSEAGIYVVELRVDLTGRDGVTQAGTLHFFINEENYSVPNSTPLYSYGGHIDVPWPSDVDSNVQASANYTSSPVSLTQEMIDGYDGNPEQIQVYVTPSREGVPASAAAGWSLTAAYFIVSQLA